MGTSRGAFQHSSSPFFPWLMSEHLSTRGKKANCLVQNASRGLFWPMFFFALWSMGEIFFFREIFCSLVLCFLLFPFLSSFFYSSFVEDSTRTHHHVIITKQQQVIVVRQPPRSPVLAEPATSERVFRPLDAGRGQLVRALVGAV